MTGRDRAVVMAIAVLVLLGAAWTLVVSPERKQVSKLSSQLVAAQGQLMSAEGSASSARAAQAQYSKAYAALVRLGKAVPPSAEVPSLVYELARASDRKSVELTSITTTDNSSSTAGSAAASSATPGAAFTQLPFTFVFEGGFFELEHLLRQLADLTTLEGAHDVQVAGRLLTIQSVKLTPASSASTASVSSGKLTGSITATAYVMPASQAVTPGTSASTPAPGGSSSSTASDAPPPAIAKVAP